MRGQFVRVAEQTHVINATSTTADARVGFTITETLVTPESDSSLTDNATGSSNFANKGAHRLKIELTLTSLASRERADSSFIEIVRVKNGAITLMQDIQITLFLVTHLQEEHLMSLVIIQ